VSDLESSLYQPKPGEPFQFRKILFIPEALGLFAANVEQLLKLMLVVDAYSIYYHLHHPYFSRTNVRPDYPGGFSIWAGKIAAEPLLAERLAGIYPLEYRGDLGALRMSYVRTISQYLLDRPAARQAQEGREFAFCTTRLMSAPTPLRASTPQQLLEGIAKTNSMSIFAHLYDAPMRLGRPENDFAAWLRHSAQRPDLADTLSRIDPYSDSIEGTRERLIRALSTGLLGRD
jgi:hypothetical protein